MPGALPPAPPPLRSPTPLTPVPRGAGIPPLYLASIDSQCSAQGQCSHSEEKGKPHEDFRELDAKAFRLIKHYRLCASEDLD